MSTHNIGFYEDLTNIIFELSSNTHLISSAVLGKLLRWGLPVHSANMPSCFPPGYQAQCHEVKRRGISLIMVFIN